MRLQAYTHDELFELGKAIVRSVTGVNYPFTERTFHRALVQVQALFAANANVESLRTIKGGSLEGLNGQLLERRALQNSTVREPASAARVAGRFVRAGAVGTAISIPPTTVVIRPATATQSELAFKSEAIGVISASETQSNLLILTCTETGEKGNAIPSAAQLSLRSPINGVSHFLTQTNSAGGNARESDADLRTRARLRKKGHGECTWIGIESLLTSVSLASGQQVVSAKVFEAFDETSPLYTGIVYAIIDDSSGDDTLIGPIDSTTYGYGSGNWWVFESNGYDIYIDTPNYPFELWDDGVNAALERDDGGGYVSQTLGTHYFVNNDTGRIALASPLESGEKIRIQHSFYTGLIKESARYVNGVFDSTNIRGWRPVGYPIRIRAPFALETPTVSASLIFDDGWDSTFGRTVASTNVLAYLNSITIGDSARYDVIQGIIHKTPGLQRVSNLLINGSTVDVSPGHKYGVVRGVAANINL